MASRRKQHYSESIKRELTAIIRELKDPRIQDEFISIVKTDVSENISSCKVYVSCIKGIESTKKIVKILNSASGYIKNIVGDRLKLRYTPAITFHPTNSIEYGINMINTIDNMHKNHSMKSLAEISEIIKKKDNFCILTHQNPDGDTIGSAFALCRVLQIMNKNSKVVCCDPIPAKFAFMKNYVKKQEFDEKYVICVDVADIKLLGNLHEKFVSKVDLCIDHHISNKKFAEIPYIDASASAAAEIIYDLLCEMNVDIDEKIAECLYTGISTDTGCFKNLNTTAKSHEIAAKLFEKNVNLLKINKNLFDTKSRSLIELTKIVYGSIEYYFGGKLAMVCVTLQIIETAGVTQSDVESITSIAHQIEGVKIGVTLKEKSPGYFKVSLRTDEETSAAEIAEFFRGGGHFNAAGCDLNGNLTEIKQKIIDAVKNIMSW